MGESLADLFVRLSADTKDYKQPMSDSAKQLEEFGKTAVTVGAQVVGALSFAAIGAGAFHAAEQFEEAGFTIRRSTGRTGEDLKSLEESFKSIFSSSAASADSIAGALSTLSIRTGLTGAALEALTKTNLQFAKVTGTDVKTAVEETQRVFHSWGIDTDAQTEKLNFLRNITLASGGSVSALISTLQTAGPVLRAIGFSFEESALLIGNFTKEGLNADSMTRFLSKGMATFAKEGITDAKAQLTALIEKLKTASQGSDIMQLAVHDLGARGFAVALDAIKKGTFDLDTFAKEVAEHKDTVADAAAATRGWGSQWTIFTHQLQAALDVLGAPLLGALTDVVKGMKPVVAQLGEVSKGFLGLPTPVKDFTEILLGITLAGPLVIKAISAIAGQLGLLGQAISLTGGAWTVLIASLLTGAKAIYELHSAEEFAQKSAEDQAAAIVKLENHLNSLGIEIGTASVYYHTGQMSAEMYMKALAALAKQHGDSVKATDDAKDATDKHNKSLNDGLPVIRLMTLQELILAEAHSRAESAIRKSVTTIFDWVSAGKAFGAKLIELTPLPMDFAKNLDELVSISPGVIAMIQTLGAQFDPFLKQSLTTAATAFELVAVSAEELKRRFDAAELAAAFKDLGIQSSASLQELADKAEQDYDTIATSANRTTIDIERAWVVMVGRQIDAGKVFTQEELNNYERIKAQVGSTTKSVDSAWKTMGREVTTIMNDLGRGIAQAIIQFKGLGDVFKKVAQDILEAILRVIIQSGIKKLMDALAGLGGVLGTIGRAAGGGASTAASAGASTAANAAAQAAANAAEGGIDAGVSGASGAAGAAGSIASSGAMAVAGLVTGIVSAVSGVIGNFQMAGMNKSLDLIEKSTRYSEAYLFNLNTIHLTYLPQIADRTMGIWGAILDLPSKMSRGDTYNITVNGGGSLSKQDVKDALTNAVRELKLKSPAFST